METPIIALVWFALWAVLLTFLVVLSRVRMVMAGETAPNAFPSGEKHGSDSYWRMNRAQINTLEYLPVFAVLVLGGLHAGLAGGVFATLCVVAVVARVLQSIVHLASGSVMAVNIRFAGLLVQLICFTWIGVLVILQLYAG